MSPRRGPRFGQTPIPSHVSKWTSISRGEGSYDIYGHHCYQDECLGDTPQELLYVSRSSLIGIGKLTYLHPGVSQSPW